MRMLTRYAWLVLVFNVGVIVLGAFVRATGSGAGCGRSWPTCGGEFVPQLVGARAIEFSHRLVSLIAILLVASLAILVWRGTVRGHPARKGVVLSAIAIAGEALIGAMIVLAEWVAEDTSVARAISVPLHLVNTLFLLASLALTIFWLSGGGRVTIRHNPRVARFVILGGLALVLLAASGAVTALADTLFPDEGIGADFSDEAHFLTRLRVIHPVLAVLAAAIGWWLWTRSHSRRPTAAKALPILVGLMLVSGSVNVALGVPVWMQLVHLFLADALWVAYVFASADALQASDVTAARLSPSR
ncbi:MAG TPA: COX15/CtaA family protein [Acidimicrobiia bacterium]